ncbi:MAG: pilus assembly protein PilP [Bdellovibrionales bacterium]|nr:pilus assembly protein PilP [Bdellovibrionales bacterium]
MKISRVFIIFFVITHSFFVSAQEVDGAQYNLFKSKTYVKNPLELRDPFKRKSNKKKSENVIKIKTNTEGIYNNSQMTIENRPIENLKIIGIVIGAQRRAMAKFSGDTSGEIYHIKEGMKLGPNGAEVKAILPGGIILVEKIRNVYDQEEYLETVIPVSGSDD